MGKPFEEPYVSSIINDKVTIKQVSASVAQTLHHYGGREEHVQGELVWTVRAPDDQAMATLLGELRDRGVHFTGGAAGWPPAEIFDELRSKGLVGGAFQEVAWRGADQWTTRTR